MAPQTTAARDHDARLAAGQACLEAALTLYLPLGLSVTWCCDPDHIGVGPKHRTDCDSPGKKPMHKWKHLQERLPTAEEVRAACRQFPYGNVGAVLGQVSGLVRVDVDGPEGEATLTQWSAGDLPVTWTFRSSPHGRGLLYGWPRDLPCKTTAHQTQGEHKELRLMGNGSQTVLPPSRHSSGSLYAWEPGYSPEDIGLAPGPAWLLERLRQVPQQKTPGGDTNAHETPDYARVKSALDALPNDDAAYDDWITLGMALQSTRETWARALWDAWSQQSGKYDAQKQEKAWTSFTPDGPVQIGSLFHMAHTHGWTSAAGRDASQRQNRQYHQGLPYSDYTNALALVREHGHNLRYCYPWKSWLVWTGRHWQRDTSGAVMRLAKQTVKRLARHAEDLDNDKAKALMAHVKASLSTAKLKAMVESAQSEEGIPVQPEDLDDDRWLLNCANGTLDLHTATLLPHRREDLLTTCLTIAYDPAAPAPLWHDFLWRILGGIKNSKEAQATSWANLPQGGDGGMSEEEGARQQEAFDRANRLLAFLQRAIGYALTGVIREHVLLILWGSGRNGKSTFLNTLRALLGPYAMKAPSELLMVSNNDRHPTERADLLGKRFVATIETEQGRRLAEVFVKEATGGDPIRARRMREDFWEFEPTHKVFLATNHRPVITGTDNAIWERIRLIPFAVTIPPEERDTALPDKLLNELPGILAWAVQGCLAWQHQGLGEPEEVKEATAGYRTEMDVLGQFITECCLVGDSRYRVKAADLFEAYQRWSGHQADNQRTWGMALSEKGFERFKVNGLSWWRGIALMPDNWKESTPQSAKDGLPTQVVDSEGFSHSTTSVVDEDRPKNGINRLIPPHEVCKPETSSTSSTSSTTPSCPCGGTWLKVQTGRLCARCNAKEA